MGAPKGGKQPDAVCLAYVHQNDYTASWADSREALIGYDLTHHGRLMRGGYLNMRGNTDGLPEARNKAVRRFLETDVPWLFWTDTDMGFQPDSLERLMATADPVTHPIVGGLCFAWREVSVDGFGGHRTIPKATILDWIKPSPDEPRTFTFRPWYEPNTVTQCAGTGSAFVVIHRTVFEKIAAEYGTSWYDRIRADDGSWIGEDISFCIRAGQLGFPIHVDTSVKTTHMKTIWVGEDTFWNAQEAPPATEEVAICPTGPTTDEFQQSLRASTGLFAASYGPNETSPWMFITPPDVVFGPGWYDHAVHAARWAGAHVVGTPGGLLIRRSYVEEQGASWDGPGSVVHDGYREAVGAWNEIIEVAKQRSVYVEALASRVQVTEAPKTDKRDARLLDERRRRYAKVAA